MRATKLLPRRSKEQFFLRHFFPNLFPDVLITPAGGPLPGNKFMQTNV